MAENTPRLGGIGVALVAAVAAIALRDLLDPYLHEYVPFSTIYGAVAIGVWYGGIAGGVLAALVGYVGAMLLFVEPRGSFVLSTHVVIGSVAYATSCAIIIGFGSNLRRALDRERAAHEVAAAAERRALDGERAMARRSADLETLVATLPTPVWVAAEDAAGMHVAGNLAADTLLGGQARVAFDDLPLARAIREDRVVTEALDLVREDGAAIVIDCTVAPLRNADGRVVGAACVGRDVTGRVEAARSAAEADRHKEEFIAVLAHELRNPLGAIRNAVGALADAAGGEPGSASWARGVIDRQSRHIERLLEDLLDVARVAHGKLSLRREVVALQSVLDAAVETSQPLLAEGGHALELTLDDTALAVDADPARLAQVISNLLHNAIRYSPPGSPIRLHARREGDEAAITVLDEGVGIAPEQAARIFDAFVQGSAGADEGLGVGLELARRIVELHGGRIEVESGGIGKGSAFTVRIAVAAERAAPVAEAPPAGASFEGLRVLVADDNRDAADSLALLLARRGCETRVVYDGLAAVETGRAFAPHAAFVDLGMPGCDGLEVARRARGEDWGAGVSLVAVSGWGREEDRRRAAEAGFDHHLVKPVDLAELERVLRTARRPA